jgi:hypothetical protein
MCESSAVPKPRNQFHGMRDQTLHQHTLDHHCSFRSGLKGFLLQAMGLWANNSCVERRDASTKRAYLLSVYGSAQLEGQKRVRSWGLQRKRVRRVSRVMSHRLWQKGHRARCRRSSLSSTMGTFSQSRLIRRGQVSHAFACCCEPAEFPTGVNDVLTLLVKSWPSISEGHGTTFHQRYSLGRSGLHMSDARLIFRAFSTYPTESVLARFDRSAQHDLLERRSPSSELFTLTGSCIEGECGSGRHRISL